MKCVAGFLYGRYEHFPGVPLGIKAVVSAIYEPPQEGTRDGVKLEPAEPEKEATLAALATNLGLQRVGWIFTDLVSEASGTVKHFRNIETYFLSSQVRRIMYLLLMGNQHNVIYGRGLVVTTT